MKSAAFRASIAQDHAVLLVMLYTCPILNFIILGFYYYFVLSGCALERSKGGTKSMNRGLLDYYCADNPYAFESIKPINRNITFGAHSLGITYGCFFYGGGY